MGVEREGSPWNVIGAPVAGVPMFAVGGTHFWDVVGGGLGKWVGVGVGARCGDVENNGVMCRWRMIFLVIFRKTGGRVEE